MTTLTVTASTSYAAGLPFTGISDITFDTSGAATADFAGSQFDGVSILASLHITGDSSDNALTVVMTTPGSFSAAAWTFTTWTGMLNFTGSSGADTIIGAAMGATIVGGGGADHLTGGASADLFRYFAGNEVAAGETVDGRGGSDGIQLNCDGSSYDFSVASISGVEGLYLNFGMATGSVSVTLSSNQIGPGGFDTVFGGGEVYSETLIVNGPSADLSTVFFSNWGTRDVVAIKGTAAADNLIGSPVNDRIDGGIGADHMTGGAGDDTYLVDNHADIVDESASGGSGLDTVLSSVTFRLADGIHARGAIENLSLTGTGNTNGTGTAFANVIVGNAGGNALLGGGGADTIRGGAGNDLVSGGPGNDSLAGDRGNDTFLFTAALSPAKNVDHVVDFAAVHDTIQLKHAIFSKIGAGALSVDAFHAGASAGDAKDRILYSKSTGKLFYDPDGTGAHAKLLFAILDNHAALTASDFVVVA